MIEKAQPEQGLRTGKVEGASSESTLDRIAEQYADDLMGKNGARALFDTQRELIQTEIGAARDEMTFGGDTVQITGRNGHFSINAPRGNKKGGVIEDEFPVLRRWDLVPAGSDTWVLHAPLIYAGVSDLGTEYAITNDAVELDDDSYVVLIIDDVTAYPYTFTLDVVPAEAGGELEAYTFDPDTDALLTAQCPIWKLSSTETEGAVVLGDFYGTKLVVDKPLVVASHLVLVTDRPMTQFAPRLTAI